VLRKNISTRGIAGIEHGAYEQSKVSGNKPILILIPGIMGSNIGNTGAEPDDKDKLVWINYLGFFKGNLEALALGENDSSDLSALSLIKTSYKNLGENLSTTYDIVTFQFDWRKPLETIADDLDIKIRELLTKNQPIKIVAHSMGGVLVRDFMVYKPATWKKLNNSDGFRGVFLGAP